MVFNKKRLATIAVAMLSLVAICFSAVGCSNTPTNPQGSNIPTTENVVETSKYNLETVSTNHVRLMAAAPVAYANTNVITQILTATVLPETAKNKNVTWSVDWGDSSKTEDVTNYVTVTPASPGSTTATVTCKQAFVGNIIVTVTTAENGYSASCIVTYVGFPTEVVLSGNIAPTSDGYKVGIAQTYTFDVSLSNPFGDVGSQFNSITVGVDGVGSVILGYMEKNNSSGNENWYDTSDETHTLDSLKSNFITVSYANGKLTVNTIKSIESYYESTQRMDGGRTTAYNNKFRSFVDDCYFKVWVKENTSGFMQEFKFRFDETAVTGVVANDTQLYF